MGAAPWQADLVGRTPTLASPHSSWPSAACGERKKSLRPPQRAPGAPSPPLPTSLAPLAEGPGPRPRPCEPFPGGLPGEDEAPSLQGHDVGVGGFYGDAQGVLPVLVPGVLVCPPFQEEAHLPVQREPAQRSISSRKEPRRNWQVPAEKPSKESGRTPEARRPTQCAPKWWRGGAALCPGRLSGSRWPRSGGGTHK